MKLAVAVAAAAAVVLASPAQADRLGFDPQAIYKVPIGTATPVVGPLDAPVTIVAWSDFNCGYCYRVQFTLDSLKRLYPGQLRFAHRALPLDEDNTVGLEAVLAAHAQGRFEPMSDRIYAVGGRVDRTSVELIARELGLDMVRFRADLDTHAHKPVIDADVKDAHALGVTGTPTFFINGRAVHGNQPLKVFADVVEEELARAARVPGGYDGLVAKGLLTADSLKGTHERFELDAKAVYRVGLGLPGHQLGPDNALVTIVAWGDFQCPFCAKLVPALKHVRQKYGDDVRIVYRHLAMRFHRQAQLAAEAAVVAANEGKFWAFHDAVFAGGTKNLARPDLERYAQQVGVDLAKLRAALDDRRYRDLVVAETADAEALGVDGTPTMFVNGTPIVGSRSSTDLEAIVEAHLQQARTAVKGGISAGDVYALFMSNALGIERADPSRVPDPVAVKITLRKADLGRSVAAACRRRDKARALELASALEGAPRGHAKLVCAAAGIDLP